MILSRPARGEEDFWRVRALLVETYPITPLAFNWDARRWEGKRFYDPRPAGNPAWAERVRLWEGADGRLVAAAHLERGALHLHLHPAFRALEAEMIGWGEREAPAPELYVNDYDEPRQRLLAARGYERLPGWGVARRMRLGEHSIPEPRLAPGYALRATREGDARQIAMLLNLAFNRDFHNAAEYRTFRRLAPSFRADLDLVAVAPGGEIAAYVGVPYDEANRRAIFEPVCTHPDHRQRGLAQALMIEGLRRLSPLGAATVTVETGDAEAANRLYDSLGFSEVARGRTWRRAQPA